MKARWANALTGGAEGALDNIYSAALDDGDLTIVAVAGSGLYFYIYDDDVAGAESSPDLIAPDEVSSGVPYAGDGRHILRKDVSLTALIAANGVLIAANTAQMNATVCCDGYVVTHDDEVVYYI